MYEQASAVPFIDINPKNSQLLKRLKKAAERLSKYSKKALKKGLSVLKRKEWINEVGKLSKSNQNQIDGSIPIQKKIKTLKRILRNPSDRARRYGLTYQERRTERKLRREVMELRNEIRIKGTLTEKRVGLQAIAYGTMEWFLVYFIRGQNEGINGILKKRGSVIGDGQHTSWIQGNNNVSGRVDSNLCGIKVVAYVYSLTTGQKSHYMRAIYNWHRERKVVILFFLVRFCRETPRYKNKKLRRF